MLLGMRPGRSLFPLAMVVFVLALSRVAPAEQAELAPKADPGTLEVRGLGNPVEKLDGPWQFHLGDNPVWADPVFDDSNWKQLTADQPWGAQGFPSTTGYGWYRRHVKVIEAPGISLELSLLIPAVDDLYAVYWNGRLIGRNGKFPPIASWYLSQLPTAFDLGKERDGVLAVRVWKAPLSSGDAAELGGFEGTPEIGSAQAIATRQRELDFNWLHSHQFSFGLTSLYFLVAVVCLLAWLRDRSQWLLFWLAGYTVTQVARLILGGLRLAWSFAMAEGLLQFVIMFQDISLWFLLLWLLRLQDHQRLTRFTRIGSAVFAVAFTLDGLAVMSWGIEKWGYTLQVADALLTAIFTPLEVIPLVIVATALAQRKRLELSRVLVAITAFLAEMTYVLQNLVGQFKRFTHWTLDDRIQATLFTLNGNPINTRTLTSTLLLIAIIYAVLRYSIDERRQQAALEQEFKNARELQQVLIPETLPTVPGFTVTSAYRPAQQVGGDFFQIISLEGGATLVILGDVSGKGLKAAMAVSLIVGAVRALADDYPTPAQLLNQLNRRLYGRLQGAFATCLILLLKPDGPCALASAGHPAPYLNKREMELPGALPLGVSSATDYVQSEFTVRPGDHFALYTDGLLEARSDTGELYGFDRIEDLFAARMNAADATEAAVNFGQNDDITVLTLTRLASGEEPVSLHLSPNLQSS
jgi:hypothetical protein